MSKWDKDLGRTSSDSQWLAALKISLNAYQSFNLDELVHKFTLRWFITPYIIHGLVPSTPPLC